MGKEQQEKVWWTVPSSAYVKLVDIKPYFSDVDLKNDRLEDMAEMNKCLQAIQPYPSKYIPDELRWYQKNVSEKDLNLPDFFKGHAGARIVSEAMCDVLAGFDLGSSQFLECPLYEIKSSDKLGRTEADRTKQDPRRWFLFHVSETKLSLNLEYSTDLRETRYQPGVYRVYEDENPTITINRDVSLNGAPIWCDPNLRDVHFYSDAVKRAIMAKGLRTPALQFKPCLLS